MEAPWPKKSTGRPTGEIRAVHRPATGAVATQGPTGATFRGHRSDHRTPQAVAQDPTGRSTGATTGHHRTEHRTTTGHHRRPQDGAQGSTGAPTGPAQAVTGRATRHHRITHRGHQRPAQRTGDGATARKARGPKPHGGMAKRAPISPPEQSANRRLPVRVGGGRPVPHKQISGFALPCGHGRPRAPRGIT